MTDITRRATLCCCALLALPVLSGCKRRSPAGSDHSKEPAAKAAPIKILHPAAPGSFAKLVHRARNSVVHLRAKTPMRGGPADWLDASTPATAPREPTPVLDSLQQAAGSGFIVNRDGRVATSARVVGSHQKLEATLADGRKLTATVVGLDAKLDVALLQLDAKTRGQLKPVRLGNPKLLEVGEWIFVLANPFGWGPHASPGVVASLPPWDLPLATHGRWGFIQTTAPIHDGNKGAPVFNLAGELVGMANAPSTEVHGTGFVLPAGVLSRVLFMLGKHGKLTRAFIGVYVKRLGPQLRKKLGVRAGRGVLVSGVKEGGPAATAGLRRGDVILGFDGKIVTDPNDLLWAASIAGLDRVVKVKVLRSKEELTFDLRPQRKSE